MDAAWEAQYKADISAQQQKKEEEERKRVEARRLQNQLQDDEEPEHHREQDLSTLPYVNLANCPNLLRKMELAASDEINTYDYAMGLWAATTSTPHSRWLRADHARAAPSVELVGKPTLATNADALWARGHVLVPTGFGAWPGGIYARDMAWAFGKISTGRRADSDVEQRFQQVFPEVPYVKPTWSRHQQFWRNSTQEERDVASTMPRDASGVWTVWVQKSSGYRHFKSKTKVEK
ncbi:hypothetical protein B0H17DRAFT_1133522 [Mycena rosella]|uniref:Uncharacterized protein n=1 Tax=Mycena rosella TaxID=1033263 RepID=A0AAD7GEV1_MYCRO|nr:hypothetical protein B0H17DRAFT_1133522 [Mycena rosella]